MSKLSKAFLIGFRSLGFTLTLTSALSAWAGPIVDQFPSVPHVGLGQSMKRESTTTALTFDEDSETPSSFQMSHVEKLSYNGDESVTHKWSAQNQFSTSSYSAVTTVSKGDFVSSQISLQIGDWSDSWSDPDVRPSVNRQLLTGTKLIIQKGYSYFRRERSAVQITSYLGHESKGYSAFRVCGHIDVYDFYSESEKKLRTEKFGPVLLRNRESIIVSPTAPEAGQMLYWTVSVDDCPPSKYGRATAGILG